MQLPIFYIPEITSPSLILDEDTSKHIVQVLRMEKGEELLLTDGKGKMATSVIVDDHRKRCEVKVTSTDVQPKSQPEITIAISLVKNATRFEWFLEKATEIGVTTIIPLICDRTERERFRYGRLHGILESAMVQSRQAWLPVLSEPVDLSAVITKQYQHKFIAHCSDQQRDLLSDANIKGDTCILIGPEGDFTQEEITSAISNGYHPVSLGSTRLRTETAGVAAAVLLASRRK